MLSTIGLLSLLFSTSSHLCTFEGSLSPSLPCDGTSLSHRTFLYADYLSTRPHNSSHTQNSIILIFAANGHLIYMNSAECCTVFRQQFAAIKIYTKRGKVIPVTGSGGSQVCEASRLPHFLDDGLAHGGGVVSLPRQTAFTPQ
jgi:hypothetical protein